MKPKILVTREVFDETLAYLAEHCEVESNQADQPFDPAALAQRMHDKDGVVCCLTDRIDDALLAKSPRLKVVANIAVALHLYHGTWSMFQSLGINNPKYNKLRRMFATGLAGLILVGNLSFPIMALSGVIDKDNVAPNATVEVDR